MPPVSGIHFGLVQKTHESGPARQILLGIDLGETAGVDRIHGGQPLNEDCYLQSSFFDMSKPTSFFGIGREGLISSKLKVAINLQAQGAAHSAELTETHVAKFREFHTEVTQAKDKVGVVGINLCQQPCDCRSIRASGSANDETLCQDCLCSG